jgi:FPC/CPF motif-containing protein YcgG
MSDVQVGSLFDSELAVANSCYTGIVLDPEHDAGRRLRIVPEGKLVPDVDDTKPSKELKFIHDQFVELASGLFPCIGSRAALHEGTYRLGVYDRLASIESVAGMGRDLRRFVAEQTEFSSLREFLDEGQAFGQFTSFIAVFRQPIPASEQEFEDLMLLHDHDEPVWDPDRSATPGHPHFAYSFAGRAFFVVGFNPQASELPRRFGYCTLVFNAEYQIARLHEEGRFLAFASAVRRRYVALAGRLNPSVPRDVESIQDETRVYSGVPHPEEEGWRCPLRVRPEVVDPKGADEAGAVPGATGADGDGADGADGADGGQRAR